MKTKLFLINYLIIISLSASNLFSQGSFSISKLSESKYKSADNLYFYTLPKTTIVLKVNLKRTTILAGPYNAYAEEFLGITNAPANDETIWDIDSIDISTINEADPDNYYVIQANKAFDADKLFKFSKQGLIYEVNNPFLATNSSNNSSNCKQNTDFTELSMTNYYKETADTFYKIIMKDSAFVKVPIIRLKVESTNNKEKAKEAADIIMRIRQSRFDDIAPEDGSLPEANAGKNAISELNKMEKKYLSLFMGAKQTDSFTQYFYFSPSENSTENAFEIFQFSTHEGIVNKPDTTATPVLLSLNKMGTTNNLAQWYSTVEKPKENHIFYRIPDKAIVYLRLNNNVLVNKQILISQFGATVSCPIAK